MAYELKTKETDVAVATFIGAVPNERRREDAVQLVELFERVTGEPPRMWGPSIIGFGKYSYKYASGHEGEMCRAGFSPRKANMVLYLMCGYEDPEIEKEVGKLLSQLGKHKFGKSCLYVNSLSTVDMDVLEKLVQLNQDYMDAKYPA